MTEKNIEQKARVEIETMIAEGVTFTVRPNSVVVLKSPHRLSLEMVERLKEGLHGVFGEAAKVMVLDGGMEMAVGTIVEGSI